MSTPAGVVYAVRWREICPWLLLVKAARVALMARVIALATLGVWGVHLGWRAIDAMLAGPETGPSLFELAAPAPPGTWPLVDPAEPQLLVVAPRSLGQLYVPAASHWWTGPLVRAWAWAVQPLTRLVDASGWRQVVGLLLAGAWAIAVWALFGGAVARIAAVYLTRGEAMGPLSALQAAASRWTSTAGAPTFSFCLIVAAGLPLVVGGLLMRMEFFAALGGVLWFVALMFGALAAGLALLHLGGFPFMWATVAVERTDAFDAVSRAWAYTYSRPLHLVFFAAVATLLGLLAEALVAALLHWVVAGTEFAVAWGAREAWMAELIAASSAPVAESGWLVQIGSAGIQFWTGLLVSAAAAFSVGYLWSAGTGIYLLMRQLVDSTELSEISFDAASPEPGVPQLADDADTGVPRVEPASQGVSTASGDS